ncbi:hypothetical protein CYMTET_20506, partial [Cymbomonas tetramitiformis]
ALEELRAELSTPVNLSKGRCVEIKLAARDWVRAREAVLRLLPAAVQSYTDRVVATGLLGVDAAGVISAQDWKLVSSGLWGNQRERERALFKEVTDWIGALLGLPPAVALTRSSVAAAGAAGAAGAVPAAGTTSAAGAAAAAGALAAAEATAAAGATAAARVSATAGAVAAAGAATVVT